MGRKNKFRQAFRRTAAVTGIALFTVLGTAGFYRSALPDRFTVARGEELSVSTYPGIKARPCEKNYTVALTEFSGRASGSSESTLMLFGAVPIKDVAASSEQRPVLIPCGETFGIKLLTRGVMVVDLTSVGGRCPARECGIVPGDIIVSVCGKNIRSNSDISEIISSSGGGPCPVELSRNGTSLTLDLQPVLYEGSYKAGMWVRDSSAGIGTLTFYDPATKAFGGLGHPVCDSDTREMLPLSKGAVGDIRITGLMPSEKGCPGQLVGEFEGEDLRGEISLNCEDGLFGTLDCPPSSREPVELSYRQELSRGPAVMISSIDGGEPEEYSVMIESIDLRENAEHDLIVRVTDERLLDSAGGIVQGMSGSPILQNGRLAGALTHVFIDDPSRGYGIFADRMVKNIGL